MSQEEVKCSKDSEELMMDRDYKEESLVWDLESENTKYVKLNTPGSQSYIYVCSSGDFENEIKSLVNETFKEFSEYCERSIDESEDCSEALEEDKF